MKPSARLTALEGVLMTLSGGSGAGASNAVATARQILEGAERPTLTLNAPRASGHEIRDVRDAVRLEVAKLRGELAEADVRADHPSTCSLPHAKMAKRGKRICPDCHSPLKLSESLELEEYPGHESLDRSPKKNWVERTGELPAPIQHMAKDIHEERGLPLDQAIPIAISQAKKLAAKGNQKYVRAVAEWETLKAKNAAKGAAKKLSESEIEEAWSPAARAAAALARRRQPHKTDWKRRDTKYEPGKDVKTWSGKGSEEDDYKTITTLRSTTTPQMADHQKALKKLEIGPGEFHDSDAHVAAEHIDALRVAHGLAPHNKRHWEKIDRPLEHDPFPRKKRSPGTKAREFAGRLTEAAQAPEKTPKDAKGGDSAPGKPDQAENPMGERVAQLQRRLSSLGFDTKDDGRFGPKTAQSVKDFQRHASLATDGIVGSKTTEALRNAPHPADLERNGDELKQEEEVEVEGTPGEEAGETAAQERAEDATPAAKPKAKPKAKEAATVKSSGEHLYKGVGVGEKKGHDTVRSMQSDLGHLGYDVTTDGRFGPETEKTVKRFQRKFGLNPDGIVGPKTQRAMKGVAARKKKLSETVDARKAAAGGEAVRLLARERVLRESLDDGYDALDEAWSAAARAAALMSRRRHPQARMDLHPDWVGHRPGEFAGDEPAQEGDRAHGLADNGSRVFGTVRGGHLVDDTGGRVKLIAGPHKVVDEQTYHKLAKRRRPIPRTTGLYSSPR